MSYSYAQLEIDNAFAALQIKAIENLTRLINSTTADFTVLQNFILNWVNYVTDNPSVDPSGNLTNILANNNDTQNNSYSGYGSGIVPGGIGDGIWDEIQYGKTNLILYNGYYPFYFFSYITALQSSDTSYTTIVQFFNQLIAL